MDNIGDLYKDPRDIDGDTRCDLLKEISRAATVLAITAINERDKLLGVPCTRPEFSEATLEMSIAALDYIICKANIMNVFDAEYSNELLNTLICSHNESVGSDDEKIIIASDILSKD